MGCLPKRRWLRADRRRCLEGRGRPHDGIEAQIATDAGGKAGTPDEIAHGGKAQFLTGCGTALGEVLHLVAFMGRAHAEHDRNVIARQRDISCNRRIAGRGADGEAVRGEADFQRQRLHGLAPVGGEALLGNPVMGDATNCEGEKRGEAFEFGDGAAAGEAQNVIIAAVGGDSREVAREQRDRRVVVGINASHAAIFHCAVKGMERGGDGGQAAGGDRLHVTERDVVGHGRAPG